jgi:hypothetical protein
MEVSEYQDGTCRCIVWQTKDEGWIDVGDWIDAMLAAAIEQIAPLADPASGEFLEISFWPDRGLLMVFPNSADQRGERGAMLCFELSSQFLKSEHERITAQTPDDDQHKELQQIDRSLWIAVSSALRSGRAAEKLAAARQTLPLKIVGYNYNLGENLIWLERDGRVVL